MADSVTDDETSNARCLTEGNLKVTFAGPAAIGIESSSAYNCGAHPDAEAQVFLLRLGGDTIAFRTALTRGQRDEWSAQAVAAGEKEYGDLGVFDGGTLGDDRAHLSLDDVLGIERAP